VQYINLKNFSQSNLALLTISNVMISLKGGKWTKKKCSPNNIGLVKIQFLAFSYAQPCAQVGLLVFNLFWYFWGYRAQLVQSKIVGGLWNLHVTSL